MMDFSNLGGLRIALVEDDPAQQKVLSTWLQEKGVQVSTYPDAARFLLQISRESFDLILLDWMLPDIAGVEVVRRLRNQGLLGLPVILVTSRDAEEDIVAGLNSGADDYLVKPVRRLEFLARIESLMRRVRGPSHTGDLLDVPPFSFNLVTRTATLRGEVMRLTEREFDLAVFLFRHVGEMLSRRHIMESVWGIQADLRTRTVDTHIYNLRTHLGVRPENGYRLSSVHRIGYRLEPAEVSA